MQRKISDWFDHQVVHRSPVGLIRYRLTRMKHAMPVDYVIARGGSLVVELWTGPITHRELIEHERAQLRDTGIRPGAIVLADTRQASFPETTFDLVHELSDLWGQSDNQASFSRLAIIMHGSDFEKARVLEDLARPMGVDTITFSNFDVACTWLGVAPAEAEELLARIGRRDTEET
jgi:hypothetical protein